ncbi:hypothetical protein NBRC110019_25900 [Neptunitalea chrysea]|uniref:T9SS type B sorting domain-containing protein n=1 Tax=Neptunitalea chrysea TaxID=1647581 RepID=A0A9W6B8Q4_9FLAO|nr:T9SS type B sorting domain-containing protein [Neptunitalea chrysea]GLB53549.1 hypothetical protein NBRC110019_25900 [Neptunitalea chrysea]
MHAQQIVVDNNYSPEQLIENILFQGCIDVSNVNSPINGSINGLVSYGYFESSSSNFPFSNGIVLTTGNVLDAGNTLNSDYLNRGETDWGTDSDLESVLGVSNTLNATVLEFDIISASNQINFNYILASEEYLNDYPCNYSDSFGFLIKPTGSSGSYNNITLVPGTTTNVSTQTIRPQIVGFCNSENEQYFEGYNLGDTNYNGRTTVLTATAAIQPNTSYHIKLIIADQFDENFDSAVFIQGNTFSADIDLGGTLSTCSGSIALDTGIDNPQATFEWSYNGTSLSDTTSEIVAGQSGTYNVIATIPYANSQCVIEDTVEVTVNGNEIASAVTDYELCEETEGSNTATFNLSSKDPEIEGSVSFLNPTISYYPTALDAENETNEIFNAITNSSNPQTVYVKLQDPTSSCVAYNSFDLIVNELPNITQPDTLVACGAENATTAIFDLSIASNQAIGTNSYELTYFETINEAENNINPIDELYTSSPKTVYIKATDTNTGCSNIIAVSLDINYGPQLLISAYDADACDSDSNGFTIFSLTDYTQYFVQNPTDYTFEFYTTAADAASGTNTISNPDTFSNTVQDIQVIYVKVIDPITGCSTIAQINLYSSMIVSETQTNIYYTCDDVSNDGVEEFNLAAIEAYILNNLSDTNVIFYENMSDLNNNTGALDETIPYINTQNPQTLYILIEKNGLCSYVEDIVLKVNPYFEATSIGDQTFCDTDSDGFTSINLADNYTNSIINGNNYTVAYYLSENDATNWTNPITVLNNTSNPQTVWAVVRDETGFCSDIISFDILIETAPETTPVDDIFICDDNNDGFYNVNLSNLSTQLLNNNTTNASVEFYPSEADAVNSSNIITTPDNYNTQSATVYAKCINDTTGCYNIQTINVIVIYFEALTSNNNSFTVCESDSDGVEGIFFEDYDNAIVQNNSDIEVLYFTNITDAENNTNAIDKTTAFFNSSNPQEIYIRRQGIGLNDCYTVDLITFTVSSNPVYTDPKGIFLCDDISNDGVELFDLTTAYDTATLNNSDITITYYTSQNNALNNINPISDTDSYENTTNPQTIYSRIETNQGCFDVTSFELNVVLVGLINEPSPISYCDTDENGYEIVDLTSDDVEVLMIRQNDINLSYYATENDAQNLTNPIANPTNYTVNNTTDGSATIIYIVATNTVSNCSLYVPLEITVYSLPEFNDDSLTFNICREDITHLNLPSLNELVIDNSDDYELTYYETYADADAETNALPNDIVLTNSTANLFVKATGIISGCSSIEEITVIVHPTPGPYTLTNLEECADDTSVHQMDITSGVPQNILDDANLTISYYTSQTDAETAENAIEHPANTTTYDGLIIYTRFENNTTGCYSVSTFSITLNRTPTIPLENKYVICSIDNSITVDAYTGYPDDIYEWSNGDSTSYLEISEPGVYSVTVTAISGCSNVKYFGVNVSESAQLVDIQATSFTDNNTITVSVTGSGSYVFSLDGETYQESNLFENVEIGYHTVEIIDLNGCDSIIAQDVVVLGFPKYFTPNGDGINDTWNIFGFETLEHSTIFIFDRYGKLLKVINPGDDGWDGTFNGNDLYSNDYWFEANIKDTDDPFVYRGHFSLIR